jgi:hypothetical protein
MLLVIIISEIYRTVIDSGNVVAMRWHGDSDRVGGDEGTDI